MGIAFNANTTGKNDALVERFIGRPEAEIAAAVTVLLGNRYADAMTEQVMLYEAHPTLTRTFGDVTKTLQRKFLPLTHPPTAVAAPPHVPTPAYLKVAGKGYIDWTQISTEEIADIKTSALALGNSHLNRRAQRRLQRTKAAA